MTHRLCLWLLIVGFAVAAPQPSAAAGAGEFQDRLTSGAPCPFCPSLIAVRPGSFFMGSTVEAGFNNERNADQSPIPVRLGYDLAVAAHEVTRAQFQAFVDANPDYPLIGRCAGIRNGALRRYDDFDWQNPGFPQSADHPVTCVSWRDAMAYSRWLGDVTGQPYRLLSEAEWEYAARGGSPMRYWWGVWMEAGKANCAEDMCGETIEATAPIGSFAANPFGLFDMNGNVSEWVADCYFNDAYDRFATLYPAPVTGPRGCARVIRGGSFHDRPFSLRVSIRTPWPAIVPLHNIGFRVAREMTGEGI